MGRYVLTHNQFLLEVRSSSAASPLGPFTAHPLPCLVAEHDTFVDTHPDPLPSAPFPLEVTLIVLQYVFDAYIGGHAYDLAADLAVGICTKFLFVVHRRCVAVDADTGDVVLCAQRVSRTLLLLEHLFDVVLNEPMRMTLPPVTPVFQLLHPTAHSGLVRILGAGCRVAPCHFMLANRCLFTVDPFGPWADVASVYHVPALTADGLYNADIVWYHAPQDTVALGRLPWLEVTCLHRPVIVIELCGIRHSGPRGLRRYNLVPTVRAFFHRPAWRALYALLRRAYGPQTGLFLVDYPLSSSVPVVIDAADFFR